MLRRADCDQRYIVKKTPLAEFIGALFAPQPEPLPEPLSDARAMLRDVEALHLAWDLAADSDVAACFWRRAWGEPPGGLEIVYLEDMPPLASEARPIDLDVRNRFARQRGKSQVFWNLASGSTWEFRGYPGDDNLNGVRPRMIWCD